MKQPAQPAITMEVLKRSVRLDYVVTFWRDRGPGGETMLRAYFPQHGHLSLGGCCIECLTKLIADTAGLRAKRFKATMN